MIRRLVSVGAITVAFLGCTQGEGGHPGSGTEAPTSSAVPAAAAAEYQATAESTVEVVAPAGWTRSTSGGWMVWASADKRAQLALAPLDNTDHAQVKVAELQGVFGASDVRLNNPQPLTIGVDRMAAQGADGAARFASGDGAIAYAVLETRGAKPVVVAYAFDKDAPPEARREAMAAVASIRKKR